jgi:hypothetical protein
VVNPARLGSIPCLSAIPLSEGVAKNPVGCFVRIRRSGDRKKSRKQSRFVRSKRKLKSRGFDRIRESPKKPRRLRPAASTPENHLCLSLDLSVPQRCATAVHPPTKRNAMTIKGVLQLCLRRPARRRLSLVLSLKHDEASILTSDPPRVQSAMIIQPSTQQSECAFGQAQDDSDVDMGLVSPSKIKTATYSSFPMQLAAPSRK